MKKSKYLSCIISFLLLFHIFGCGNVVTDIKNPSFESGSIGGWTALGEAFSSECISFNDKAKDGSSYNKVGDFFLCGEDSPLGSTGTLTSVEFTLKGNGNIGFLLGAGRDVDLCYVALVDARGKELVKRGNDYFYENNNPSLMNRLVLDCKSYIGKKVRIQIVDNDSRTNGYNYLNVDDFIIGYEGEDSQVSMVDLANKYVEENKSSISSKYKPKYHAVVPIGWGNDPNGLVWFNGEAHMYYQCNPYSSSWGPMHWGHFKSSDFVKWEFSNIALAPDKSYDKDNGAFSGSAIVKDGKLYVLYTGVADGLQQQCLAVSDDSNVFTKYASNPVIKIGDLPKNASKVDFRDPYIFEENGQYYLLVGTKTNGYGNILLYKSTNLTKWDYVGSLMNNNKTNEANYFKLDGVFECPTYANVDGYEILGTSAQNLKKNGIKYQNIHSVIYMIGHLDKTTGKYTYSDFKEFDSGFDYYAVQFMKARDGRTIAIAWKEMWDRSFPSQKDGWAGTYTLPRELSIVDGVLYQKPVREIKNYYGNKVTTDLLNVSDSSTSIEGIKGTCLSLEVEIDVGSANKVGVKLFKGPVNETSIYYDSAKKQLVFDRSNCGVFYGGNEGGSLIRYQAVEPIDGKIKLQIFLDVTSCEVFANDGLYCMTGNIHSDLVSDINIEFFAKGGNASFVNIVKNEIIIG